MTKEFEMKKSIFSLAFLALTLVLGALLSPQPSEAGIRIVLRSNAHGVVCLDKVKQICHTVKVGDVLYSIDAIDVKSTINRINVHKGQAHFTARGTDRVRSCQVSAWQSLHEREEEKTLKDFSTAIQNGGKEDSLLDYKKPTAKELEIFRKILENKE